MAIKELTLPVLISLGGVVASYGAITTRVNYAEKVADKALERAEGVAVLDERTKTMQAMIDEIHRDIKTLLAK